MSQHEFEGYSDGEWDERWDIAWNEFDWERYLRAQETQLGQYLKHYANCFARPDRIDEVAHLMGWDQETWTNEDPLLDDDEAPMSEDILATEDEADSPFDPYTLHRHPVYVSTKALYLWLIQCWQPLVQAYPEAVSPAAALRYQAALHRGQENALLAIQALDMGDYALCVCLLKRALGDINAALDQLNLLDQTHIPALARYRDQARARLFDIREIWLRVMRDCREEVNRRFDDRDPS
ncbi:MAG: hypothetical protein EA425_08055 [Puniceicoccaceae bacterium]|nr:MAG: hypothetical protein EA425_08055 [Puniceicoccaceae bacterium]